MINEGEISSVWVNVQVLGSSTAIKVVRIASSKTDVARVAPTLLETAPYLTTLTAVNEGTAILTAEAYLDDHDDSPDCSGQSAVQIRRIEPWLQTKGGDVHGSEAVGSKIPTSLYTYFSLAPAGVVSTGDLFGFRGTIERKMSEPPSWRVADESERLTKGTAFGEKKVVYDYQYYWDKFDSALIVDFNGEKPRRPPLNGKAYFGRGNVATSGDWQIGSTEKLVILIDGDLSINRPIRVAEGGFLALIVSGNIRINSGLGAGPASETPQVEGLLVANGTIETGVGKTKLVVRGTLVVDADLDGEGGFNFGRDLDAANRTYAAEFFEFEPDFLVNFPSYFGTKRILIWQEVAP